MLTHNESSLQQIKNMKLVKSRFVHHYRSIASRITKVCNWMEIH